MSGKSGSRAPRRALFGAAIGAVAFGLLGGSVRASASTDAAVSGPISTFAVPSTIHFQQLFSGSDGRLWFATPHSQLGEISTTGQATLTGVTLPHGNAPAVIAGAGATGVWSFSNTAGGSCLVTRVAPGNVIQPITLPAVAAQAVCGGGAADGSGNLWLSLGNPCGSFTCGRRVSFVAEITAAGSVTLFPPVKLGARTGPVALAADGSIWVLGGYPQQALGRYTSSGSSTGITIPAAALTGLLARPDGTFWGTRPVLCIGQTSLFCERVVQFAPGGTGSAPFIFPVGINLGGPIQMAVDSTGGLWEAGGERTQPDRFFRMNSGGTIDRSAAFPTVAGGSTLRSDGTLAISATGDVWTTASTGAGAEYLVRFTPSP